MVEPQAGEVPPGGPPTEEAKPCKFCDKTFPSLGELGKHMWAPESEGGHHETMLKLQKEGLAKKAEEKAEKKPKEAERGPTPLAVYKGEPDAMGILREILEKHPDISEAVKEEVLDWARLQEFLPPQTVAYLLGQMRGISSQTANIVAQKYALALQKAQLEGRPGVQMPILPHLQPLQPPFQVPIQGYPQPPYPPFQAPPTTAVPPQPSSYIQPSGYPQPYPYTQPTYPYQPPPSRPEPRGVTTEEVRRMVEGEKDETIRSVRQLLKEDREEKEKETMLTVLRDGQEQTRKLLERIEKGEFFPKGPPTPPTPPVTKEELSEAVKEAGKSATESALKLIEAKSKEDREDQRHKELLSAVRGVAGTQAVSGYKEDSYRFLGQGLQSLAGAIEGKQPIKVVLEKAPEILYGRPAELPEKKITPGAGEGLLARLRPEWIAAE